MTYERPVPRKSLMPDQPAPKPDHDGTPAPPPAPIWRTPFKRKWGDTPPKKMPTPPEDHGQVLCYYNESSRRNIWNGIVVGLVIFFVPMLLVGDSLVTYVEMIWPPVLGVATAVLFILVFSESNFVVGSDWIGSGRRWVDTYDLVKICVSGGADAGRTFWITDSKGRRVNFDADRICSKPKMWNLVYNGMAHSVANGCKVTGTGADFVLKLDRFKPTS